MMMEILEIENAPFHIFSGEDGLEVTHGRFVAKKEIYRGEEETIVIRRPDGTGFRIEIFDWTVDPRPDALSSR